ncbi:lipopolysaccharide biosynthesis protein [bacterium]|nr:lipopolysaccharide biosynthesis protein [bacterium]
MRGLLRRLFTKGTFASNVATLGSGTAIGQISMILAAPILSRLFSPEDFGELQFILSIALILGALSTLRYEMALPLVPNRIEAVHLLILASSLSLILTIIVTSIIPFEPMIVKYLYESIKMKYLLYFIPLILLFEAQNSIFSFWFTRTKNFKVPSIAKSFFGIGTALAQISIAVSGIISSLGLLAGYLIGLISSAAWYIYKFFKTTDNKSSHPITFKGILDQAKTHKNFPLYSSWNVLLNTIARNLPPLLLVSYFSVAEAGYYAIGIRMLNMPFNTLGMSVGQVYYQQIARYREQGIPILPLMISTSVKLTGIIILPLLIIFFFGEQLFGFVFGDAWKIAGRIAALMVPFYFMRFIAGPINSIYAVQGKQYLGTIWQAFYSLGTFASFYFTRSYGDFELTIKTYSFTGTVLFFILLLMTIYNTKVADINSNDKHRMGVIN